MPSGVLALSVFSYVALAICILLSSFLPMSSSVTHGPCPAWWFSNVSEHLNHLEGLLKQISGCYLRVADSIGLGGGLRFCDSSERPHLCYSYAGSTL